jgi:hypothetical protein
MPKKGKTRDFLSFLCIACIPLFLSSLFAFERHQEKKNIQYSKKMRNRKNVIIYYWKVAHTSSSLCLYATVYFFLSLSLSLSLLLCRIDGSVSCLWTRMESEERLISSSLFWLFFPYLYFYFCSHHLPFALIVEGKKRLKPTDELNRASHIIL